MASIYIVQAKDDYGTYNYEFGNLPHAMEIYNLEKTAIMYEYDCTTEEYHFMFNK